MQELAGRVLRRPMASALGLLALTLGLGAGLPLVHTEFGYRPLLGANHPEIRKLEGFIDRFGGGLPVLVVWTCENGAPCHSALDEESLRMADAVERRLRSSSRVRDLRSPASATVLVPSADGIELRSLVESGAVAADLPALLHQVRSSPLWQRHLISEDERTGAIVVQPADAESQTSEDLIDAIFAALEPEEARGFRYHLVGHAVEFAVAGRELAESTALLTPLTLAVVAGVLTVLFRSISIAVATLLSLGVAMVWSFGLLGWLGWPQDAVLQTLAPLILVVGGCDAIHLVTRLSAPGAHGTSPSEQISRAARDIARPCVVTSVTTALAFASFATSDLETFVRFGLISAFAVLACLVASFTALPLLLARIPGAIGRGPGQGAAWRALLEACADAATRRRQTVLAGSLLVAGVSAVGLVAFLRVDTDGEEMYGEHSRVIRWIRHVEQHLSRPDTLELELTLPSGLSAADPDLLHGTASLAAALETHPALGRATSLLEPMGWLSRGLGLDASPAGSAAANAELIELLGFQDPQGLERFLDFDRRHLRVSVEADFQSAAERGPVLTWVRETAKRLLPPGVSLRLTGPYAIGYAWVGDVQATQLRSFAVAFVLVLASLAWHMRSLRWAVVAMVPTVLPALVVLGAMGWLGLSLDVGRAMIAAVILGIGVDDTIHLLDRTRRLEAAGATPVEAISGAVVGIGRAVITTSLALSLGFLSLMVSSWQTVSSFGFFVGLGILLALFGDLFVLPALVASRER